MWVRPHLQLRINLSAQVLGGEHVDAALLARLLEVGDARGRLLAQSSNQAIKQSSNQAIEQSRNHAMIVGIGHLLAELALDLAVVDGAGAVLIDGVEKLVHLRLLQP
eukprot:244457-Prymnesium_polylepis.1